MNSMVDAKYQKKIMNDQEDRAVEILQSEEQRVK